MSFFIIETRSGKELQTKEMLKHLLKTSEEAHLVNNIYALNTCTSYIETNTSVSDINENDTYNKVVAESVASQIGNLKKQYEGIKRKTDGKSVSLKTQIRQDISKLEKELHELKKDSKKMKAILPGYIVIQLNTGSEYLPNTLWNLIMKCPLVRSVPSRLNVPEEEIKWLFDYTITETQVELQFETVMDEKEIAAKESTLLHKANTTTNSDKESKYLEKVKQLENNFVSEVQEIKKSSNTMMKRVKAFIKNNKETINMPVSLFFELYHEFKEKNVLPNISSSDFLGRFNTIVEISK